MSIDVGSDQATAQDQKILFESNLLRFKALALEKLYIQEGKTEASLPLLFDAILAASEAATS